LGVAVGKGKIWRKTEGKIVTRQGTKLTIGIETSHGASHALCLMSMMLAMPIGMQIPP
jgi:hypothetical protein